ncbi:MAG: hypothetical protein WB562_14515 [Candidatus Sulfotelmatobacter sp.]
MDDGQVRPVRKFLYHLIILAGALACVLVWLKIEPKDLWGWHLSVTLPHWMWLAAATVLFLVGITSSGYSLYRSLRAAKQPSKLIIHWANYRALPDGGDTYDVADFLRLIICGDSLVLDIENHNFAIGGKNFVPHDPLAFKPKRLKLMYSYAGGLATTIVRYEHDRLVLPEDSEIKRATAEIDRARQSLETERAATVLSPLQQKLFVAANQFKKEALAFMKANPKPEYSRPSDEAVQAMTETLAWKKKFAGWYRSTFAQRLQTVYDELVANGINDRQLETAFTGMSNIDPSPGNVALITNKLRMLALQLEE